MYLSNAERYKLEFLLMLQDLKQKNLHLYKMIKETKPIDLYYVRAKESDAYLESVLSNGMKIKAAPGMAKYYTDEIKTIFRNY